MPTTGSTQSEFIKVAIAVDPIIRMLKRAGLKYPSVTIYDDGSGHLTVEKFEQDKAKVLLEQHGVNICGYLDPTDDRNYEFELDLEALRNFKVIACPHCGEEIDEALD